MLIVSDADGNASLNVYSLTLQYVRITRNSRWEIEEAAMSLDGWRIAGLPTITFFLSCSRDEQISAQGGAEPLDSTRGLQRIFCGKFGEWLIIESREIYFMRVRITK